MSCNMLYTAEIVEIFTSEGGLVLYNNFTLCQSTRHQIVLSGTDIMFFNRILTGKVPWEVSH